MKHRSELLRLLSSLCDDQLSPSELARLEDLLADEDARRVYLQYTDLHARLLTRPAAGAAAGPAPQGATAGPAPQGATAGSPSSAVISAACKPQNTRLNPTRLRHLASYSSVVAATLAASFLLQLVLRAPQIPSDRVQPPALPLTYVATLSQASDVQWGPATQAYRPGSRLLAGDLELRHGIARLGYDGGVELIVEGPARLRLESGMAAELLAGKVVFRADDAAAPFTLSTPSAVLVDQGTEYAVEVHDQQEEVHVFSGEVQRLSKAVPQPVETQTLAAGEARRFGGTLAPTGEATPLEPARFVRQLPTDNSVAANPAAALLAYEPFEYASPSALRDESADGGSGFSGQWGGGFARLPGAKEDDQLALNVRDSLVRLGHEAASSGGSFDHSGFAKYFRRLQLPVRLDADGVYYLSFLFRREGPPLDPLSSVSVQFRESAELTRDQTDATTDLRKRLNFGVDRTCELFTHLERIGRRMPLPLSFGETYLLMAKVAASGAYPDQVFLRVYGPQEPVDPQEPATWSAVGPPIHSDLVFDWLEIHINSHTRQTLDEIRLGTTWESVASPWLNAKHEILSTKSETNPNIK